MAHPGARSCKRPKTACSCKKTAKVGTHGRRCRDACGRFAKTPKTCSGTPYGLAARKRRTKRRKRK